jgi:ABC-type transport system substrate-binding protein
MRRFAIALMLWAGCVPDGRPRPDGLVLRVGTTGDITEPEPYQSDGLGAALAELVFRSLVRVDADGRQQGDIGESWSWGADGRTLSIQLRSDIPFSDGSPLEAANVVETYRRAMEMHGWGMEEIQDISARGRNRVELKIVHPFRLPPALLYGVARMTSAGLLGAGAYTVASRDATKLVLHANPQFSGPPPAIKTIEYHRFEKASEEWSRLLSREIDLITFVPWAKNEFLKTVPTIREVTSPSKVVAILDFFAPQAPFDRPAVRYGLSLMIDRDALIGGALRGHGRPANGLVWPRSDDFDSTVPNYPYDPREALKILGESGIKANGAGRLTWDGQLLDLTIHYWNGSPEIDELALQLERQLSEAGLVPTMVGQSMEDLVNLSKANASFVYLHFRHASSNLLSEEEARPLLGELASAPMSTEHEVIERLKTLQQRMYRQPPSIYLFWQERLDIIDTRFCGLPALPDGPEAALNLVHPCVPGELN